MEVIEPMATSTTLCATKYPNLGVFPEGCRPMLPAIYRHGPGEWHATDGRRRVFGPFPTPADADLQLDLHLADRQRRRMDALRLAAMLVGGLVAWLIVNCLPVLSK